MRSVCDFVCDAVWSVVVCCVMVSVCLSSNASECVACDLLCDAVVCFCCLGVR